MANEDVIRGIAVQVAVIAERVEHLPALIARVDALEASQRSSRAWKAGAIAALTALSTVVLGVWHFAATIPPSAWVVIADAISRST